MATQWPCWFLFHVLHRRSQPDHVVAGTGLHRCNVNLGVLRSLDDAALLPPSSPRPVEPAAAQQWRRPARWPLTHCPVLHEYAITASACTDAYT
jgi:hypothetical protein